MRIGGRSAVGQHEVVGQTNVRRVARLARAARWTAAVAASAVVIAGALPADGASATSSASAAGQPQASSSAPPPAVIDAPRHGEDAIDAVGLKVRAVAAANGMTPSALKQQLVNDDDMWLDKTGRLTAIDADLIGGAPQQAGTAAAPATAATAPFDYAQTFKLHSHPGSHRVIYLDFNGHLVSGTAWNSSFSGGAPFTAEPYDTDGNGASFSNAEQDVVQRTWQRVSEDYAPFDIDVTTEEPAQAAINRTNAADLDYGTRLVVTNTATIFNSCSCGGIAYVGVFDVAGNHDAYQPGFVFTRGVGTGDKNIAEAASHEIGHNLGLSHDGTAAAGYYTGQGSWAPIMGVGYYKAITQWSRGEYAGANNTQDDLAVMQAHGATLVADEAGDAPASAKALPAGTNVQAAGVIATPTDVDVFSFNAGAGTTTITLKPAALSPDLDIRAQVLDATGKVVADVDPASGSTSADNATGLDATISLATTNATYYVKVDGTGSGSAASTGYSDYGSLGQYTISGTTPAASSPPPPTTTPPPPTTTPPPPTTQPPTTTTPPPPTTLPTVRVGGARVEVLLQGVQAKGSARIVVTDLNGKPVVGATLTGSWSGSVSGKVTGTTAVDGSVVFNSALTSARPATFTFTVQSVAKTGMTYVAAKNLATTVSAVRR